MEFHPVTPEDIPALSRYLPAAGNGDCNLTVASLVTRAREKEISMSTELGALTLRWRPSPEMPMVTQAPIGCRLCEKLIRELEEASMLLGEPLRLYGVLPTVVQRVSSELPYRNFAVMTVNSWWDFLYDRKAFAGMEGRKLHGKRNFVRRFQAAHPSAVLEPITHETIPLCREYLQGWYAGREMTGSLTDEQEAIGEAFEDFEALRLQGGVLRSGDRVFGFTYGTKATESMFAVHIEKADKDVPGAYAALAVAFARSLPERVSVINREEDLGIAGLRKAKQDWQPVGMLQKGYVTLLPDEANF